MPASFDRCIEELMKQGKDKDSSYAICTASFKKKYGMNPQDAEKKGMSEEDLEALAVEEYERKFEMPPQILNTISTGVELEDFDEEEFEQHKTVDIEVLRAGKFKHPEYGTIEFNGSKFKTFIKNFEEQVPQAHIAYDFKHRPDWGAAAWIRKLFTDGQKLFATVELTRRGYTSLKNREFLFFSTEYHDNYTCRETGKKYGPTILGGGLTNRPFIKGMAPIILSEDGEEVFVQLGSTKKTKGESIMLAQLKDHLDKLKAKIGELYGDVEEEKKVPEKADLTEVQNYISKLGEELAAIKAEDLRNDTDAEKLEELSEQVKSLGERAGKIRADDKNADSKLEKLGKRVDVIGRKLDSIDFDEGKILAEENKRLQDQVKKLAEGNDKLGEAIKKLQEKNEETDKALYAGSVKAFTKELEEAGFWPSTCQEVSAVLEAYDGRGETVVQLSEEQGEGNAKQTVEHKLTLQDVVSRILHTIPKEARIDLGEKTKGVAKDDTSKKKLGVKEIEAYAKENSLTYANALIRLSADPETKDLIEV